MPSTPETSVLSKARAALLVTAGLLVVAGAFLPWVSWRNFVLQRLPGTTIQCQQSVKAQRKSDKRLTMGAFDSTSSFRITVVRNKDGTRLSARSPVVADGLIAVILTAGAVCAVAAAFRNKLLVSVIAVATAIAGGYPFLVSTVFVLTTPDDLLGIPLEPALGVGMLLMPIGVILGLVGAGLLWLDPSGRLGAAPEFRGRHT